MSFRQGDFSTVNPKLSKKGYNNCFSTHKLKKTQPKTPISPLQYSVHEILLQLFSAKFHTVTMYCTSNSQMLTYLFHRIDAQY